MQKQEDKPARPDPIINILGSDLGRWQLYVCAWIFLSKFPTGWVQISMVFLQQGMTATCEGGGDACAASCKKPEFNRTIFEENIVSEWGLVCDKAWMASSAQSILMVGIMVGNFVFGLFADRYGRRPMFVGACVLQLIAGCLVSAAPWFWLFVILRFLDGVATGGTMSTGFTLLMEIVGKSKREIMAILYQIPFNLGHATLPVFAYFLRNWRWYHLSFSTFSIFYLIFFWTVPESPRWLLTTGRIDRANDVLEKGARMNKVPTENIRADLEAAYKAASASAAPKKGNVIDLFRYPYLRQKTIAMAFNWLNVCMGYYGLAQHISSLGGDIFVNVFIGAMLGVPGTLICVPMTKYMGRRITLFISNLISGVALIGMAIVATGDHTVTVALATIGLFGASITFPNVYLYAGELFPTVVRTSGVGLCSLVGRVGSIVAPFIAQMSSMGKWIPPAVFGVTALLAAASVFLMPETRGVPLPETIEDGEAKPKKAE